MVDIGDILVVAFFTYINFSMAPNTVVRIIAIIVGYKPICTEPSRGILAILCCFIGNIVLLAVLIMCIGLLMLFPLIVGFFLPLAILNRYNPDSTAFTLAAGAFLFPHVYWLVKLFDGGDIWDRVRAVQANPNNITATGQIGGRRNSIINMERIENMLIFKKVVEEEPAEVGVGGNNRTTRQPQDALASFRSKHPKSDIIVKRKVDQSNNNDNDHDVEKGILSGEKIDGSGKDKEEQDEESSPSSPLSLKLGDSQTIESNNTSLNLEERKEEEEEEDDDDDDVEKGVVGKDKNNNKREDHEQNDDEEKDEEIIFSYDETPPDDGSVDEIEVCNICLEEYKVGETIAWSRNPECHHVFHKECLLAWLGKDNHDDCPVCRKKYDV